MQRKKILIVDDEKDLLTITKFNLEEANKYAVMTLSTTKDIISHVHSFLPDVILLDNFMPIIRGIDACEMLNSDPIAKKIPIIILSAFDMETDRVKAYKAGAVDYLIKPIGIDELIAKIEDALQFKNKKI